MPVAEKKTIELWDGFVVKADTELIDDFDFVSDLNDALNDNDMKTIVTMYMAVIGGNETYEKIRDYLTERDGRVTMSGMNEVIDKINDAFPKSGNRAQRRSWKTSR